MTAHRPHKPDDAMALGPQTRTLGRGVPELNG
jgi:hypothetical protein